MQAEYHKWQSDALQREMELKVYGHAGKPFVVFPSQEGRFFEFEDFGMIEVCRPSIEAGILQLFTVDSTDAETWTHPTRSVPDRIARYEAYEKYIVQEVVPFVYKQNPRKDHFIGTMGCSMGAYHASNFFFRHPEIFDALLSMSGIYQMQLFLGEYMDEQLYYHTPLNYLRHLKDEGQLEHFRKSQIILSVGQGDWEHPMLEETLAMKTIFEAQNIPAWVDVWGKDVAHDWPWWRKKMAYFLMHLRI
jgi:esterase/lipase superfamily enzyme